ncbi:MAG TPA: TolC family outer membrane protein [Rhizomicrobium sp.]|nr:TolC family outer membrane protein [Rhizomicrobium sp.]
MSRVLFGAAVAAFAAMGMAAQAETITLNDALGLAYETNPNLDASRAGLRATDENVAKANAGWRPTVNIDGQYGYQREQFGDLSPAIPGGAITDHPIQGQLTVTQPLFRGGKTIAEVGRAKALVRAGRAQLIDSEQQTLLGAVAAYMNVVRDTSTVKLRENNVAVLQKQLDATTKQFQVGELTKTDVSQSQARLAGAQAQLTLARGQLASDRAVFEQVIGRPAEALEEQPALPKLPATEEEAAAAGTKNNPIVVGARDAERAADLAVDDAVGSLSPQLGIQGQYQYQKSSAGAQFGQPGNSHVTTVFAQVTVPIYQGGAEYAEIRQAKELHSQTQLQVVAADRQVQADVQSAWNTYVAAKAAIESNQAQVDADQIAYEGVKKEQEVGGRTILDVLNAQQELLNAQVAVVSSQRDAFVAAYQVLQSTGQLTARYLKLNVKYYDPHEHYDSDHARWIGFGD